MEPTVTVITATWNSSRTLQTALASLIAQTFQDWESWVIGDFCTDDSEAVVRSFGDDRLHWVNLPRNSGSQAFPNNEGLRRARGRYVAYLGHDDLWFPEHLEGLIGCLEGQNADLVHSICGIYGPERLERVFGPPHRERGYDGHFVPPSSWMHRRSVVDSVGFWKDPTSISLPVDTEFLRRISRAEMRISCHPRLSVVKIPSWRIALYGLRGEPPQTGFWRRIQTDPAELERESLSVATTELSRMSLENVTLGTLIRQALVILKTNIRAATEFWPVLSRYYVRRCQMLRGKQRKARGIR